MMVPLIQSLLEDDATVQQVLGDPARLFLGSAPQDTPHPCYMSITAVDYQTRQWLAPFTAHYDFPIRLLPVSSSSHYALESSASGVSGHPLQAEPLQDELFLESGY